MTKDKKNLIIKNRSEQPLQLFEAADSTKDKPKYIFKGIFTECSTPDHVVINRNQRSYPLKEVASHVAYLREQIKESGFILGELDHPSDGRFDTSLKQASHAILDIWVDFDRAVVEGKLQLLDTPNGKIAQTLVEAGYPLYVSSRAAGSVGNDKNHTVKIDQLFSYDIVCVPGFANARLQRIDESLSYKSDVDKYLNESASYQSAQQEYTKNELGITSDYIICESVDSIPVVNEKAKKFMNGNFDMDSISKPLLESDDESGVSLPTPSMNPNDDKKDDEEKNGDENLTSEEKADKRKLIVAVEAVPSDDESTESEKEEKRAEILSVEAIEADDEDEEFTEEDEASEDLNVNIANGNEVGSNNTDSGNGSANGNTNSPDTELKLDAMPIPASAEPKVKDEDDPTSMKTKDKKNDDVKSKVLNDKEKAQDVKDECDEQKNKVAELLKKVKKVNDVKESIVKNYPFSISLSDENFAKFAALAPGQKNKVQKFILEHGITDIVRINEQWATPLIEEKRELKNWMRLATKEDRRLFAAAPMEVQDAIEESAKYVVIRTADDCNRFWEKTGLRQQNADRILRESMKDRYTVDTEDKHLNESAMYNKHVASELGYSMDYFKYLEDAYQS